MESEISIKDLGEASVLLTLGYKLARMRASEKGNHKIFIFMQAVNQDAEKDVDRYRSHDIQVDAYSFFMATKELKARIHDMNDREV